MAPPPVTVPADAAVPVRRASRSSAVAGEDLADTYVWWDDIMRDDGERYKQVLSSADS